MMAMAHREATGTQADYYINGASELAGRRLAPATMVVVLDDVAGSGDSLDSASISASSSGYQGQIVISPMVSTAKANKLFTDPGTGITSSRPNTSYQPGRVMSAIKESPYYKGLTPAQQRRLLDLLGKDHWGLGYDDNGLSMAFPYMAPDNNSMFGDGVAKDFIMNQNRDAAKSGTWKPKATTP
jgi:hypothetical protein